MRRRGPTTSIDDTSVRNGTLLYKSEELVYEDTGWGIITDSKLPETAYATHRCSDRTVDDEVETAPSFGEFSWTDDFNTMDQQYCGFCAEPVPDSVVTLVRIYNFPR